MRLKGASCSACVLILAGMSYAQVVPAVVFKSGGSAPGVLQGSFYGTVASNGELTVGWAGTATSGNVTSGFFRVDTLGSVQTVPLDPAAGLFVSFGEGAFGAWKATNGAYTWLAGEPLQPVVSNFDPVAGQPGQLWITLFTDVIGKKPASANRRGDSVFHDSQNQRLGFSAQGGTPQVLAQQGSVLGGLTISRVSQPIVSHVGTVFAFAQTFGGGPEGGPWALLAGEPGNFRPILNGTHAPGLPAGSRITAPLMTLVLQPAAAVARDGHASSVLGFSSPVTGVSTALFTGDATGMRAVFWGGQEIDRLPAGWRIGGSDSWHALTANTGVAGASFSYAISNSASVNQTGIVVSGVDQAPRVVMVAGDAIPGVAGVSALGVTLVGLNRWEDAVVDAFLAGNGIDSTNNRGLLVHTRDQGLLTLLQAGQLFELAPGDVRTVLAFDTSPGSFNGMIDDLREVYVNVSFADTSTALVRFTIPTPHTALFWAFGAGVVCRRRRAACGSNN